MFNVSDCSGLKGFRFRHFVIGYTVWTYHCFGLSLRDVEDFLASRDIKVSYEMTWDWTTRLSSQISTKIRKDRPGPADKWHLDEVVLMIKGVKHWFCRAVDAKGMFWTFWYSRDVTRLLPNGSFESCSNSVANHRSSSQTNYALMGPL